MDVKEVSEYTGLSQQTIYNLVSTKKIPFKRLSARKVLFEEKKIARWMKKREKKRENKIGLKAILNGVLQKRAMAYGVGACVLFGLGCLSGLFFMRNGQPGRNLGKYTDPVDIKAFVDSQKIVGKGNDLSEREVKRSVDSDRAKMRSDYDLFNAGAEYAEKAKTIDIVTNHIDDPDIKKMLVKVMSSDRNMAIRMKAVTALSKNINDREIKKAFLRRMENEENDIVRYKILDVIIQEIDSDVLKTMDKIKDRDKDPIIKSRIESVMKKYRV